MGIIIFAKTNPFGVEYSENISLGYLATFLTELDHNDRRNISEGLRNKTVNGYSTYYTHMYVDEGIVNIYTDYDNSLVPGFDEIDLFQISVEKFIELLEKFDAMLQKEPSFSILKISGDEFSFEYDYREVYLMDRSKIVVNEKSIENSFGIKTHNGLINEGFHLLSEKPDNATISNEMTDIKNTVSVDIKINKDFTFNRAMFQEIYNKDDIVGVINEKLSSSSKLYSIKYNNKAEKLFYELTIARKTPEDKLAAMRIIYNEKSEVIACYPIFEDMA